MLCPLTVGSHVPARTEAKYKLFNRLRNIYKISLIMQDMLYKLLTYCKSNTILTCHMSCMKRVAVIIHFIFWARGFWAILAVEISQISSVIGSNPTNGLLHVIRPLSPSPLSCHSLYNKGSKSPKSIFKKITNKTKG